MAIEAIAASLLAKEVAGKAAVEATKQLAEKMAVESVERTQLAQTIEQTTTTTKFRVGEVSSPEISKKNLLESEAKEAASELSNKIEKYSWDDRYVFTGTSDKTYSVEAGKDSYLLNGDLPENATIKVYNPPADNIITVKTDDLSRNKVTEINVLSRGDGFRNEFQQQRCRYLKGGFVSDDAGHLLAREFNGPPEQINYLPMDSYTNRIGEWRNMEKSWKNTLESGGSITNVRIESYYEGKSKRPTGFDVSYCENGDIKYRYIDNTPRHVDLLKDDSGKIEYNFLDKNS